MDPIFDRLGNLLRSLFPDSENDFDSRENFSDPDMQEAWKELNEYMKSGQEKNTHEKSNQTIHKAIPEEYREDFKILNVPFGASIELVAKSYKKLLIENHPDRFATHPEKVAAATEITKILNRSYHRLKSYYRSEKA
jgi:DnaJ-domain-containing protein 1